jgi:hypothetical protein
MFSFMPLSKKFSGDKQGGGSDTFPPFYFSICRECPTHQTTLKSSAFHFGFGYFGFISSSFARTILATAALRAHL